jgi:hypothetical protein
MQGSSDREARKPFESSPSAVRVSEQAVRLHATMLRLAGSTGVVRGQSRRSLAALAGISYWRAKKTIEELSDLGLVACLPGASLLFPAWRVTAAAVSASPQVPWDTTTEAQWRAAGRASCTKALARLLKVHGDRPPDAEAAAAVARIRKGLPGVLTCAR